MKKLLNILLVFIMCFILVGCNGETTENKDNNEDENKVGNVENNVENKNENEGETNTPIDNVIDAKQKAAEMSTLNVVKAAENAYALAIVTGDFAPMDATLLDMDNKPLSGKIDYLTNDDGTVSIEITNLTFTAYQGYVCSYQNEEALCTNE